MIKIPLLSVFAVLLSMMTSAAFADKHTLSSKAFKTVDRTIIADKVENKFQDNELKIFTGDKLMWVRSGGPLALEGTADNFLSDNEFLYGFGSTQFDSEKGTYSEIYTENLKSKFQSPRSVEMNMIPTEIGFLQEFSTIRGDGVELDYSISWVSVTGEQTKFDGLWRLISCEISEIGFLKNLFTSRKNGPNNDPDEQQFDEVKMIGGGHFIFVQSSGTGEEQTSNFGYGELVVDDGTTVHEIAKEGTRPNFSGRTIELDMQIDSGGNLIQSFVYDDNDVVLVYSRI